MARLTLQISMRDANKFENWLERTNADEHNDLQTEREFSDVWVFTGSEDDLMHFESHAQQQAEHLGLELDRIEFETDETEN